MGGAKKAWMEIESLNLRHFPDKSVCKSHIKDKYVNRFIRQNSEKGYCDYCHKNVKVVDMESLMRFIIDKISNFYGDACNYMHYESSEGGYTGEVFDNRELILEHIELEVEQDELLDDIIDSIEDLAWSEPDSYFGSPKDELKQRWAYFSELVKHKSRYLFTPGDNAEYGNVLKIIKEVGGIIASLKLIRKISKDTILYRCRQHTIDDCVTSIADIASPPIDNAIYPNRFSPSGIPMLYTAFDRITAYYETISTEEKTKKYMTTAQVKLIDDVFVVDFSRLPNNPSYLGITDIRKYYLINFLHDFVNDLTKRIKKDGKEHIEYVPTQIITEYIRYPFNKNRKNKIEGIIYPSSKDGMDTAAVFFWDNNESCRKMKLLKTRKEKIK